MLRDWPCRGFLAKAPLYRMARTAHDPLEQRATQPSGRTVVRASIS